MDARIAKIYSREALLITELITENSPFCLTRAITRIINGLCYPPFLVLLTL
jgi:hypothetical protein